MENDPAYRDLPAMSPAREGKMPPHDVRINWGLWVGIALALTVVAVVGWLIRMATSWS